MFEEDIEKCLPVALNCGYRLIDTATIYKNEQVIGRVLKEYLSSHTTIKREDFFITSKVQSHNQGYELARRSVLDSLERLQLDYLDLYLIHWPGTACLDVSDPKNAEMRKGSWRALEELLSEGKLRAIGVSNYMMRHLTEMESYAKFLPMVNQIELHPLYFPKAEVAYCQSKGILVQAYSSLGRGKLLANEFLDKHEAVKVAMSKYRVEAGQVYLRWALQHGFGILPKSNTPERIRSNFELDGFELSAAEMEYLDGLHLSDDAQKICWNPDTVQ